VQVDELGVLAVVDGLEGEVTIPAVQLVVLVLVVEGQPGSAKDGVV
jgi:hypothetical protein